MQDSTAAPGALIRPEDCLLVVIDMQEKLLPVIAEKETILENNIRLARFARIVGLPVLVTEQEKLGTTVPALKQELGGAPVFSKITFDCLGAESFKKAVETSNRTTLILTGIEAHICVAQTALRALERLGVHVVSDAMGSRSVHNLEVAQNRLGRAGAVVTSTEMVMYELLQRAGTPEFKATLPLVK